MGFIKAHCIEGLLYVPECGGNFKKHKCDDCFCCQNCSDARCDLCLRKKAIEVDNMIIKNNDAKEDNTGG